MSARTRYNDNFSSSIFSDAPARQGPAFVPAGKRRDQSTAEMFGDHHEKDLRGMPKTFCPREDHLDARQKKQLNLTSGDVVGEAPTGGRMRQALGVSMQQEQSDTPRARPYHEAPEEDAEVDASLVRQVQLSSKLFGRETPAISQQQVHDKERKLMPNDFSWDSYPQAGGKVGGGGHMGDEQPEMSAADRAYTQRRSELFGQATPAHDSSGRVQHQQTERIAREEEEKSAKSRAGDQQYSDLFGRSLHGHAGEAGQVHARARRGPEESIVVHQDWTDSRTELLGQRPSTDMSAVQRKHLELNRSSVGSALGGHAAAAWDDSCSETGRSCERPPSLTFDNSNKTKDVIGRGTQQIHQAHLRSSLRPDAFYQEAACSKDWEVCELHISGLPRHADEAMVKRLCQGVEVHLARVTMDMDPVRNYCKGRARVMVRYNPAKDSTEALIRHLEASNLRVEV